MRRVRMPTVLLVLLCAGVMPACTSCPPAWAGTTPEAVEWTYGVGEAGEVFVDADAVNVALTRAARSISAALGLDVERRLSVVLVEGKLFVEAYGPEGRVSVLDDLELVELTECDDARAEGRRVYVLLRLPADAGTARGR